MNKTKETKYTAIYKVIKRIPLGRVATYGQIARIAGFAGHARLVGYALHSSPQFLKLPWHRVVNARGELSRLPDPDSTIRQRELLALEGIVLNSSGKIDLKKFRWKE